METLQRNEIAEIQRKQFRSTLIRCLSSSRFYIKEFKKMGLRLEDIQTIEDLQKIGFFTTKEDLRLNYPMACSQFPQNKLQSCMQHQEQLDLQHSDFTQEKT